MGENRCLDVGYHREGGQRRLTLSQTYSTKTVSERVKKRA